MTIFPGHQAGTMAGDGGAATALRDHPHPGGATGIGDELLEELCTRRLDHARFTRVYLDVAYVKDRVDGEVVFQAIVAVTGVRAGGAVEILGVDIGDSESPAFWRRCLQTLVSRGLAGVRVVASEDHRGVAGAVAEVFPGARWECAPATVEPPSPAARNAATGRAVGTCTRDGSGRAGSRDVVPGVDDRQRPIDQG